MRPRGAVRAMAAYKPPAEGREGKLRLDFNENTVGASPVVTAALRRALSEETLTVYPEYAETRAALAGYFGVTDDEFLLTNGTDEAIQVLVNTFVDAGDEVAIVKPSYAMYRFYAEAAGARVVETPYADERFAFPLEQLMESVGPRTRAILVANPNNPVGTGIPRDAIQALLRATGDLAVLIDEAYFEFSGETVLDWIGEYSNLVVSRTFSKAFGMAAMRCGCLFSQAENVAWMRKAQSPYSVNTLAAIAARAAVSDPAYVANYAAEVKRARAVIEAGLRARGIQYVPSQANFVLFHVGAQAAEVCAALRERGVLIRNRSYELPGWVRVTAGTTAQAERFLNELESQWKR